MARTQDMEELKRIIMDLDVVLKAYNCEHIVRCFGFFITEVTEKLHAVLGISVHGLLVHGDDGDVS